MGREPDRPIVIEPDDGKDEDAYTAFKVYEVHKVEDEVIKEAI